MKAKEALKVELSSVKSKVHLSFNGWTSTNFLAIFGIVAHYLPPVESAAPKVMLLSMAALDGPHSGENQFQVLWKVIQDFGIAGQLGFTTTDNASTNDSVINHLSLELSKMDISYDPTYYRLRCFSHIINLVCNTMVYGKKTLKAASNSSSNTHPPPPESAAATIVSESDQNGNDEDDLAVSTVKGGKIWDGLGPYGRFKKIVVTIWSTP